jgi:NADH-quinone oxidoreductase subunit M
MLTALFIAPALTAVLLLLVPRRAQKSLRAVAISGALVSLGFAAYIATAVQSGPGRFSFEIRHSWIASIGSSFHIGVDGLSIWFLLLNAVLAVVAVSSTDAGQPRFREHLMFLMLLETSSSSTSSGRRC